MFDFQQISRYRENNRLEAKLATGGLPRSIWETYSAFANTYGGVILLGVEELPDHTLRVQGLLEPRELVDEFTAAAATGTTTVPGRSSTPCWAAAPTDSRPPVTQRPGACQICASASSRIWLHSSGRSRKGRCPASGRERNTLQGADRVS